MKNERLKMTVEMEVTEPQALALQAMFEYWDRLASIGSSRFVAFMVDGDGNFKPRCKVSFSEPIRELTTEMRAAAVVDEKYGDRKYDFDPIAWMVNHPPLK
jgi:hypothetical protein